MKSTKTKKVFKLNLTNLILVFMLICIDLVLIGVTKIFAFSTHTPKFNFGYEKILLSDENLLTSQEKIWLNDTINENDEVLIVFVDEALNLNDEDVISKYTDKICPYVIFRYNFDNQTLVSSQNELVNFDKIETTDAKYSDIYTYLPRISSNYEVPLEKSLIAFYILLIVIPLFMNLAIIFAVFIPKNAGSFIHKGAFFSKSVYIKMPKDKKYDVKCIEANNIKNSRTLQISSKSDDEFENRAFKITYNDDAIKYVVYVANNNSSMSSDGTFKVLNNSDIDSISFKYKIE